MGSGQRDFKSLNARLLEQAESLLSSWIANGYIKEERGKRLFRSGDLRGAAPSKGGSFSVDLDGRWKGHWRDWSTGERGSDLISLYAAVKGTPDELAKAFDELTDQYGRGHSERNKAFISSANLPAELTQSNPVQVWLIRGADGAHLGFDARYNDEKGKKSHKLWSWSSSRKNKLICKAPGKPWPLYGSHELRNHPDKSIMIVEGPKKVDALNKLQSEFLPIAWHGGCQNVYNSDWSPIYSRNITLWPDNDAVGILASLKIAEILWPHCGFIDLINVKGLPEKFDAADLADPFDQFIEDRIVELKGENNQSIEILSKLREGVEKKYPKTKTVKDIPVIKSEKKPAHEHSQVWDSCSLSLNSTGRPHYNEINVKRVFKNHPVFKGKVWFDEFYDNVFIDWQGEKKGYDRFHDVRLQIFFQEHLGFTYLSHNTIHRGLIGAATDDIRNEPKDWMETLKWDGQSRIETFFHICTGSKDDEYTRALSRNFWLCLVKRIYEPGCKVDTMVILEGNQGLLKSTLLKTIVGKKWTVETRENPANKDFYLIFRGKWIVEVAELSSFAGVNSKEIKNVLSTAIDTYRAPYERMASDHPRQCIFVATTNETVYLEDETGNRRFWPIELGEIKLDKVEEVREQCFAEAVAFIKKGSNWWEMPPQAAVEQEARRITDPWEEAIERWMIMSSKFTVTIQQIMDHLFQLPLIEQDRRVRIRIGKCLRALGYQPRREKVGKDTVLVFHRNLGEVLLFSDASRKKDRIT